MHSSEICCYGHVKKKKKKGKKKETNINEVVCLLIKALKPKSVFIFDFVDLPLLDDF